MITHVPASERHFADNGWLETHYLFSFADYYDPANTHFGTLRVLNDDRIAARQGFGMHSHDNMEIVTIVLVGELTHRDSMGNGGTIRAGEVQYMSAGSGVTHSEMNESGEEVHLYQIWIFPNVRDAEPRYAQKDFSEALQSNVLIPVAAGKEEGDALVMRTDATIFLGRLEAGKMLEYSLEKGRGAFLYLTGGILDVNGTLLNAGDQARVMDESVLNISATEEARFVLIDVPMGEG